MQSLPTGLIDLVINYVGPDVITFLLRAHKDELCWSSLNANPGVPKNFLCQNKEKLNSDAFWGTNEEKCQWRKLSSNPKISMDKLETVSPTFLTGNPSMPLDIVWAPHLPDSNSTYWFSLCGDPNAPMDFICVEENRHNLNWLAFCGNPSAQMDFILAHKEEIIWYSFCGNPRAPLDFIFAEENKKYLDWWWLSGNERFFVNLAKYELTTLLYAL